MSSNSLRPRRLGLLAAALVLSLLAACGGKGGYSDTAAVPGNTSQIVDSDVASKFEFVLADFEGGVGGLASFDTAGNASGAVTLAASTLHFTHGAGSVAATLNADAAMIGLTPLPISDWREYRSVLVGVYSDKAIAAADIALVTKSGSGWTWCALPAAQGVTGGAKTTLSFPLDWRQTANCLAGTAAGDVKGVYLKIGGGTGNVVYVNNLRITKAVRVMALGDSITGAPGCWRKKLLEGLRRHPGSTWSVCSGTPIATVARTGTAKTPASVACGSPRLARLSVLPARRAPIR